MLLLDNIDSFTFMLADTVRVAGAEVIVARNDALTIDDALTIGRDGIVISPGPGEPGQAGISVALAAACVARRRPLLGICLGHQALALACGGKVDQVTPMHGKIARVRHDRSGLFARLDSPFGATRYHSLAVTEPGGELIAQAWSEDNVIMAIRHTAAPAHGLQFHPESIATPAGATLIGAFVALCREGA